MEKKSILIVSRSFYPQNSPRSFRTTELAKELSRQGNEVTVLIPKGPEHDAFAKQHNITIKDLGEFDDNKAARNAKKPGLLDRIMGRYREQYLLQPIIQLKDMVYEALKKEEGANYDLLISVAAPHPIHWGVTKALKKYKNITKKWIADCGDPFMLSHNLQYKRPFYFKKYETDFCRNADYITIPAASAKDGYYKEFHDKLRVIPQGFRFEDVKTGNATGGSGTIQFGYAGSLIQGRRDPSELLNYLTQKGIDFRFVVYSKNKAFVDGLAKKYPGKVEYKGEADRLDLLYHLSELDFVINFENVGTNQTPSKLIDYAIIKKPILSIMFGNLDTAAVDEFMQRNYASQLKIEDVDQYRIENVAKNFLNLAM